MPRAVLCVPCAAEPCASSLPACRQAYGAGRYHLVGLVLQRALLLLTLVALAVAAVWTQAEPILLFLRQDPEIAHGTAQFLLRCGLLAQRQPGLQGAVAGERRGGCGGRAPWPADVGVSTPCVTLLPRRATPALWFTGVFEALKRYLMAQASAAFPGWRL